MKEKIINLINYKVLVLIIVTAFLAYTISTGNTMSQVFFDLFKQEAQTLPATNQQIIPDSSTTV